MYLLLKLATSEWKNASRDKRELSVAKEVGFRIEVIAKQNNQSNVSYEMIDGYKVNRLSTRPLGDAKIFVRFNRIISLFTWAKAIRIHKADVISCHDLIALVIGFMSNVFNSNKALLVYDSHEFEIGKFENRNKILEFIILHLERFLINKAVSSIMVNDYIADEVVKIHSLSNRPIVVRNIPEYWELDFDIIHQKRQWLLSQLNSDKYGFLVMHHGGIVKGRGIERLINSIPSTECASLIIIGDGDKQYIESLVQLCEMNNVRDRVLFLPAVKYESLWQIVGAADVGIIPIENTIKNHLYSLPNKYFENIQSLTPIIHNSLPAMNEITNYYKIGLSVDCSNPDNIASAIDLMNNDRNIYDEFKLNLNKAKNDLCWEKENKHLKDMYLDIWHQLEQDIKSN